MILEVHANANGPSLLAVLYLHLFKDKQTLFFHPCSEETDDAKLASNWLMQMIKIIALISSLDALTCILINELPSPKGKWDVKFLERSIKFLGAQMASPWYTGCSIFQCMFLHNKSMETSLQWMLLQTWKQGHRNIQWKEQFVIHNCW